MNPAISLANHLQGFFQTYLREQKGLSPHTILSYRDTFKVLVAYLQSKCRRSKLLSVSDLDIKTLLAFLQHLEDPQQGRGNSVQTRNQRLAAIQGFFQYLSLHSSAFEHQAGRVTAIPRKKAAKRAMESLNHQELEVLLAQPSPHTPDGIRDLTLLTFLYNTGARASEVAQARRSWFDWSNRTVNILGKGRKQRLIPLWLSTIQLLKLYADQYRRKPKPGGQDFFFIDQRGLPFSRFGIRAVVKRHLKAAARKCSSLAAKRLSTHSLRHTTAVHLLEAKVELNVIRVWLGHESLRSTGHYLTVNLEQKRRILEHFGPPSYVVSVLTPKPNDSPDQITAWLNTL